MKAKNVLITGASGYLGSNLCYSLRNAGWSVHAIDVHAAENVEQADVSLPEFWQATHLNRYDAVYMLAGKTGTADGFDNYLTYNQVNEQALLHLLDAMRKQAYKGVLVFPSTRLVYKGKEGLLSEDSEKQGLTPYAINKIACEEYIRAWSNAFGLKHVIFRVCVPYGQLIPSSYSYGTIGFMLGRLKQKKPIPLYGDGSVRRTFTHVEDIVSIFSQYPFKAEAIGKTLNIGGEHYSLKQIAEVLTTSLGGSITYTEWPPLAKAIESGHTQFCDDALNEIAPFAYSKKFAHFIDDIAK